MRKILYISYDGLTSNLGMSQILPYIEKLSSSEQLFIILSAEQKESFQKNKVFVQSKCKEHNIIWIPIKYRNKPPIVSTLYTIRVLKKKAKQILKKQRISLIHCRSYIPSLIGLYFQQKTKTPFLFDMRGFWADERVDGKIWELSNPIYNKIYTYFKRKEKELLLESKAIISLTYKAKKEMLSWAYMQAVNSEKINVIPCCVNQELFNRNNINEKEQLHLKEQLKLEDKYVFVYIGSIGTWYLLDEMLAFFSACKKQIPNSIMLFLTKESPSYILNRAKTKGIDETSIIIKSLKHNQVPSYLLLANAAIFFIKQSYSKMASSPIKQGEIMSMGIPIICNSHIGDTDAIIKKYKCGYVVECFNEKEFQKAIQYLLDANQFSFKNAIQGASEYFGLDKGVEKYQKVYNSIIENE